MKEHSSSTPNLPVPVRKSELARPNQETLPAMVAATGAGGQFAWEEFLFGNIANEHTRKAYGRAVHRFLTWCEKEAGVTELQRITPKLVRTYLDQPPGAPATKKQQLSAIRHFLDICVTRHVLVLNPALSVRGERLQVVEGKTPEISVKDCRKLLASIDPSS